MRGFIGHTDHGWWRFLQGRPEISEVNFWRPGGRRFSALSPGEPFFFRLKSPINRIGGFGLFAREARMPVWRAWEVFEQANGTADESDLLDRVARLARRRVTRADVVGCVAVAECMFFTPDDWVDVPASFRPQNLSGSLIDLDTPEGSALWRACLQRAAAVCPGASWTAEAIELERTGRPVLIRPRLGQGSFRLAVLDAYDGACAVTGEHALPALEAAHIRPWSDGGTHQVTNGIPLRRDLHRLFDLGYVSATPNGCFLVSPRLRSEFMNGRTYYALEGRTLRLPPDRRDSPDRELLAWHSQSVFQAS